MGKKYTHEEIKNKCLPKFNLLEEYLGSETRILCKCLECGNIFNGLPKSLIKQKGCPKCGLRKARETKKYNISTEDFKKKLFKIKPNIEALGEYVDCHTKISVKCRICNYEWLSKPTHLCAKDSGCLKCGHKSRTENFFILSQKEYEDKIFNLFGDKLKITGKYIKGLEPIKFFCSKCNKEYSKTARVLLSGRGCLICRRSKSNNEDLIEQKLKSLGVLFEIQFSFKNLKSKKGKPMYYDFCILDKNNNPIFIIEFHGDQHYKPIKYFGGLERFLQQQESDNKKEQFLIDNKIPYIILNAETIKNFDWEEFYEKYETGHFN